LNGFQIDGICSSWRRSKQSKVAHAVGLFLRFIGNIFFEQPVAFLPAKKIEQKIIEKISVQN
jgi:hypothetical protein